MLNTLLIAIRNVSRNRKRTLLTVLAVTIGLFVVVAVRGTLNGLQAGIKKQLTEAETGDIQIHRQGYLDSLEMVPLNLNLVLDDALEAAVVAHPEAVAASGRILFAGLISDELRERSTTFIGRAIDIAREQVVCPDVGKNLVAGRLPAKNDALEVVVAQQLAQSMKLGVGSEVTLASNSEQGAFNALDFRVVGIVDVKMPTASKKLVVVPLGAAQELLLMPGKVTEIVVDTRDYERAEAVAAELQAALAAKGVPAEVSAWSDVAAFFTTIMGLQDIVFGAVVVIIFVLVLTGIINTMLMSVFERVREIGTLMAIGYKRRRILVLFLIESAVMGVMGAAVGAAVGVLLVSVLGVEGVSFVVPGSVQPVFVFPSISLPYTLAAIGVGVAGAVVSALYPAWRASRMRPAEAIRAL